MIQLIKKGVKYIQKENGTLYAGPLDQENKVGGEAEEERNAIHNAERRDRVYALAKDGLVLDYGAGSGLFFRYLNAHAVKAVAYDRYSEKYSEKPYPDLFSVVTMIEVVEHLAEPYAELDEVFSYLKEGGYVIIESSFVDWMKSNDPYINPELGHSTIFSHAGLDELMIQKGFVVGNHFNRNVRLYIKPKKEVHKLTLVTMSQGNPIALQRTLENTKGLVDEVILGDVAIFEEDKAVFRDLAKIYNMKIVSLPFNYIFKEGFSNMLNFLSSHSTNYICLYLNVGELISEGKGNLKEKLNSNYNAYYQIHPVEKHHWVRTWNRKEMSWSGRLHEECVTGNRKLYPQPIFTFIDSEKDIENQFYSNVMSDVKELTYFHNLVMMVENPEMVGGTHAGWIQYAKDSYDSLNERLTKKGSRYEAFLSGDWNMYYEDILTNPEFEKERFESSTLINFQGNRKDIL